METGGEQAGGSQAVFYSTLLKQLRQKAGDVGSTNGQLANPAPVVNSTREDDKPLPKYSPRSCGNIEEDKGTISRCKGSH